MITLVCSIVLSGTLDQAAAQALTGLGDDVEYAGALIGRRDGTICKTEVVRGNLDHFEFQVKLMNGEKLLGLFHTHVVERWAAHTTGNWRVKSSVNDDRLSENDLQVAQTLKVRSYVRVNRTGQIIVGGKGAV